MNAVGFAAGQRHSTDRGPERARRDSDTGSNVETVRSHYQIRVNHAGRPRVIRTCVLKKLFAVLPMRSGSIFRRGTPLLYAGLLAGLFCLSGTAPAPRGPHTSPTPDTGGTAKPAVQKYLVKGTTEAQLGDYEEAILYFETALNRAPEEPALLLALADAHEALGDYATALFYARKARSHAPERAYYHRRFAELQRRAGQREAAVQSYRELLDRFPDNGTAYRALADLQSTLNRPDEALRTYRAYLEHTSRTPVSVYRKMLALYQRTGDADGIEHTLRILVDRRPNDREYRRRLGEHYAETGRSEAALDLLAPLATQHPDDTELQRRVRALSRETGRANADRSAANPVDSVARSTQSVDQLVRRAEMAYDEAASDAGDLDSPALRTAEELLQRVLDRAPRHVPALSLQARIHEQRGEYRSAGQLLERAVEENPRRPDHWARAAAAYLHAHAYDTAASVAEEGLLLFPGHPRLPRTAAFARLRSGAPGRARDHFQQALDLRTDASAAPEETAVLTAGLGLAYTLLDRPRDAEATFEKALARSADHPTVLRTYAYSLALRRTQLDKALKLARRAVDRSPDDPLGLDTLGWVYFQRGNLEAARRHLQTALDAAPPSARLLEHFGDVQHAAGNDTTARQYWKKALHHAPDNASLRKKLDDLPSS